MPAYGAPVTYRRRPRWVRLRVLLAVGLLCGAGATSSLASWTDPERAAGTFTAATVPAPVMTKDCGFVYGGLLGLTLTHVEIYWQLPAGADFDDVVFQRSTGGLGSVLAPITGFSPASATVPGDRGTYTTRVPISFLGGLAGLGAGLRVGITVVPGVGNEQWRSTTALSEANLGVVAGIGAYCVTVA